MLIRPVLTVMDMQNGFCAPGGTLANFGFNITPYREVVPRIKRLVSYMREKGVPIYYLKAVKEPSGLDAPDRTHRIIPKARRQKIEMPLCIRGSRDSEIVDELKPAPEDYIVEKRRDSVFQGSEFELWIKAFGVDALILCGIDTYLSVESTAREAFTRGYDVIVLSDWVASINPRHQESSLQQIGEVCGLVVRSSELIDLLERGEVGLARRVR